MTGCYAGYVRKATQFVVSKTEHPRSLLFSKIKSGPPCDFQIRRQGPNQGSTDPLVLAPFAMLRRKRHHSPFLKGPLKRKARHEAGADTQVCSDRRQWTELIED
jgi:hypothetical protein